MIDRSTRIGILTLPLHHNYGAILQAYALQRHLHRLGFTAYLIDRAIPPTRLAPKDAIGKLVYERVSKFHTTRFSTKSIVPRTSLLTTQQEMEAVTEKYALGAVVVGSDQVWRVEYSRDIALNFFLDFVDDSAVKKVAYAASFGSDSWNHPDPFTARVRELLAGWDAISVREASGVTILRDTFGLDAVQMIDSALLLQPDDYIALMRPRGTTPPPKTLAVYFIDRPSEAEEELVRRVSARTGLSPRPIHVKTRFVDRTSLDIRDSIFPSVGTWLAGLHECDFVVTDSFHGVVFSLMFNKPFVATANEWRGPMRIKSLLNVFGLANRFVSQPCDVTDELIAEPIDFARVNEIRQSKVADASEFLRRSLG